MKQVRAFIHRPRRNFNAPLTAISLFAGGGIGDLGYEQAGFRVVAQCEKDPDRAALCMANFPHSSVESGTIGTRWQDVVDKYRWRRIGPLQLLSITPPCQGMSSSNPGRGKITNPQGRDVRNQLLLDAIPVIHALKPRVVVAENVMQVLKEKVRSKPQVQEGDERNENEQRVELKRIVEAFEDELDDYRLYAGMVQMADYGIPQVRKRAVLVGIRKNEPCVAALDAKSLLPWPKPTHSDKGSIPGTRPWVTLRQWLDAMQYAPLDARDKRSACWADDPLHFVPAYEGDYYLRVADIPTDTGRNSYENSNCRACGHDAVPAKVAHCERCGKEMTNRPYVRSKEGEFRLVKGFDSSYRRMWPDRPAPTITTATGHVGSDYKIHPWQNRVLSIRECADLQTIPRFYEWEWAFFTNRRGRMREVVGEALPSYFTYLHGKVITSLLSGQVNVKSFAST